MRHLNDGGFQCLRFSKFAVLWAGHLDIRYASAAIRRPTATVNSTNNG